MFVETRTTVDEVLADILKEVAAQANSVINSAWNKRQHPTYITIPMLQAEADKLYGMVTLAGRVTGRALPDELAEKVQRAYDSVREIIPTKKK